MSSKKLTTEEKIAGIQQHFMDRNMKFDLIYYLAWGNKCILSSTFYLPDNILVNDLQSLGITTDEYNSFNQDQRIDFSTKIFNNHMKAEYDIISSFAETGVDITSLYQIRYHTSKVAVDKVYKTIKKCK